MAWSVRDIPSLAGTVAVVTGANGGLGLETARALAGAGAHVVMAARDQGKAAAAHASIVSSHPGASLELVPLDLASLASVDDAAKAISSAHDAVGILVNNAGLMAIPERTTADGFEMQMGVNHLGHWVLTARLMPALLRARAARVVAVTSTAHLVGRSVSEDDPHLRKGYSPWAAYVQSKLANFYFGLGLARAFARAGVTAASLVSHPGLTDTELQRRAARESGGFFERMSEKAASMTGMSAPRGALSQLRAATDPRARNGEFYGPLFVNAGPPVRKPVLRRLGLDAHIDSLWRMSERETGIALTVDV